MTDDAPDRADLKVPQMRERFTLTIEVPAGPHHVQQAFCSALIAFIDGWEQPGAVLAPVPDGRESDGG